MKGNWSKLQNKFHKDWSLLYLRHHFLEFWPYCGPYLPHFPIIDYFFLIYHEGLPPLPSRRFFLPNSTFKLSLQKGRKARNLSINFRYLNYFIRKGRKIISSNTANYGRKPRFMQQSICKRDESTGRIRFVTSRLRNDSLRI